MEEKLFSFLMDCSSTDGLNLMSLEDSNLSSSKGDSLVCKLCNSCYSAPRVLHCLHTYCEKCLEKELISQGKQLSLVLKCPSCRHETKLTSKGVSELPLDYVMCNEIDLFRAENKQIFCTSCKAQEKAVGRCSDCSSFLCPNCVTAHQYMRCFENHKVISFDEMKSGECLPFHTPIKCSVHCNELMKYFCHTCQALICSECIVVNHQRPEHDYERFQDTEDKVKEELFSLISESKSKMQFCADVSLTLNSSLADLQSQRDDAKSLIMETYQSYKSILEKCQEDVLKELALLHSAEELKIMEYSHLVDETLSKMEHACKFSDSLLNKGNSVELLSLKKVVKAQLLYLINNTPKPELNIEIKFHTDASKFEKAVKDTFGKLKKPVPPSLKPAESISSHQTSPLHSSSSFDSDGLISLNMLSPDEMPSLDVDFPNNFVARCNLAQLVGIAERSSSRGPLSSTEIPSSLNELLVSTTASEQSLCQTSTLDSMSVQSKLASLSLTNSGQVSFTRQKPPALSMENMTQQSRILGSNLLTSSHSLHDILSPTLESGIAGLLNGRHSLPPQPMNSTLLDNNTLLNGSITSLPHRVVSTSPLLSPNVPPISSHSIFSSSLCGSGPKSNTMQIRCKFGQLGSSNGQFSSPHGFCLGLDQEIIVADTNNHRIQVFDKMGEFKFHFGNAGKEEGQLWYPRKVAVIRPSGKYVICDRGSERSRMQIFTKTGHFIKKIAIRYIDIVAGLAITNDNHIVAVDSVSPTVFIISESGELVHWFDCSEFMREPSDIAVSGKEFYICDFKGHCVSVFSETGQFQRRIGCESITNFPNGIDISDAGDILVGDSHGNRFHVVVFSRDGCIASEYECPYVKVSRCCGLKITSEGFIVTLAKNNHHVLILNTLYVL